MTRKQAEQHLKGRKPGSFIVRESTKQLNHVVLSVLKKDGSLFNGLIKHKNGKFILVQGQTKPHESMEEVINAGMTDLSLIKGLGLPCMLVLP